MTASPGPHVPPSYHGPSPSYVHSATTTLHHNDDYNIRDRLSAHLVSTSLSPAELDEEQPVPATKPTIAGPSASFLEPAKHARANRPPGAQPYPTVGSQPTALDRRGSGASIIRPPSPHFPSMALALSRSASAPGAVYIDWEEDDPENPMNWPQRKKWGIVICCFVFTGATAALATAYAATEDQIVAEFGIPKILFLLGNTTYLVSVAFAPLVLAPFSELVGRRLIFIISAFLTALMVLPQALATNIEAILISRVIQGAAASAGNSVTGGVSMRRCGRVAPQKHC